MHGLASSVLCVENLDLCILSIKQEGNDFQCGNDTSKLFQDDSNLKSKNITTDRRLNCGSPIEFAYYTKRKIITLLSEFQVQISIFSSKIWPTIIMCDSKIVKHCFETIMRYACIARNRLDGFCDSPEKRGEGHQSHHRCPSTLLIHNHQ